MAQKIARARPSCIYQNMTRTPHSASPTLEQEAAARSKTIERGCSLGFLAGHDDGVHYCNGAMPRSGHGPSETTQERESHSQTLTPTALKASNSNALEASTRSGEC